MTANVPAGITNRFFFHHGRATDSEPRRAPARKVTTGSVGQLTMTAKVAD